MTWSCLGHLGKAWWIQGYLQMGILPRYRCTRTSGDFAAMLLIRPLGPGPLRLRDWTPIADCYVKKSNVILHADAVRAYRSYLGGGTYPGGTPKKGWQMARAILYKADAHQVAIRAHSAKKGWYTDYRWSVDHALQRYSKVSGQL